MKIKLFRPYVSPLARKMVQKVLCGTWLAEGPMVKKFEKEFAKKFKLKNVAAVNSGTSALELAYELADIKPGDEVIAPVLTCVITNVPLVRRRAKIIFADIDYDLNMNIDDVKKKITPKTKAIVFMHFGGNNRGLKELLKICKERRICLIEDAAQAVGSDFWGKADFAAVSLQAVKMITSGDGGFLICKNKKDCDKAKRLRWFGYDRDKKQKLGDIDLKEAGYKYQMCDVAASKDYAMERWLQNVAKLRLEYPADFLMVDNSSGLDYVEKVKGYCEKYGITDYKIEHLELPPEHGFLLEFGTDAETPKTWETGEAWFKTRVLRGGGNYIELYGVINPIYHLDDKDNK